MKIRTVSSFIHPAWPLENEPFERLKRFNPAAQQAFEEAAYEVQTTRLLSSPFPDILPGCGRSEVTAFAKELENRAKEAGYGYVNIGPAHPDTPASFEVLPDVLAQTEIVSASGRIAGKDFGVSLPAVRAAAEVIHALISHDPNGFGNFFFTASANVPPGGPFFPAGYHDGGPPAFAIGTEAAVLAVEAFTRARTLAEARANLVARIEEHAAVLEKIARTLADRFEMRFLGLDFTLAPFPETALSIGTALEALGLPAIGRFGSTAAAAFLMDAVSAAQYKKTGFNGLLLPVLEDASLAAGAAGSSLSVKDLLLMSTVCGTGLDTVPIPGDVSPGQIAALLLDIAALSLRLNKPLTARLVPVPGKKAGDQTGFDFPFFANTRVMALEAGPLNGLFAGDERFNLGGR